MINVTKTYLPDINKVSARLQEVWASGQVTNNGPMLKSLEDRLTSFLQVPHLQLVTNGTIAIQLGIKAFELKGNIITTPFSYVATTNSVLWENCTPLYADISAADMNVNPDSIEALIDKNTSAMLFTHVYGIPCDVERIEQIARKYNIPVIYDAAHAFNVQVNGRSVLTYGNLSTLSFHATKIFHSVEGGAIVCHTPEMNEKLFLLKSFGHKGDDYFSLGINGKNSEMHAAVGHCVLDDMQLILDKRKLQWLYYQQQFAGHKKLYSLTIPSNVTYNYSYFPLVFETNEILTYVINQLKKREVFPRRYFYPSLNKLPFFTGADCPVSESISSRVICLPLFHTLETHQQEMIVGEILSAL